MNIVQTNRAKIGVAENEINKIGLGGKTFSASFDDGCEAEVVLYVVGDDGRNCAIATLFSPNGDEVAYSEDNGCYHVGDGFFGEWTFEINVPGGVELYVVGVEKAA